MHLSDLSDASRRYWRISAASPFARSSVLQTVVTQNGTEGCKCSQGAKHTKLVRAVKGRGLLQSGEVIAWQLETLPPPGRLTCQSCHCSVMQLCQDAVQAPSSLHGPLQPQLLYGASLLPRMLDAPFNPIASFKREGSSFWGVRLSPSAGPRRRRRSASWGRSAASASRPASRPAPVVRQVAEVRNSTDGC